MLGALCSPCCGSTGICEPQAPTDGVVLAYSIVDGLDGSFPERPAGNGLTAHPGFSGYQTSAGPVNYLVSPFRSRTQGGPQSFCPDVYASEEVTYYQDSIPQTPGTAWPWFPVWGSDFDTNRITFTRFECTINSLPGFRRQSSAAFKLRMGAISCPLIIQSCLYNKSFSGTITNTFSTFWSFGRGEYNTEYTFSATNVLGQSVSLTQSGSGSASVSSTSRTGTTWPVRLYAKADVYSYYDPFPTLKKRYQEIQMDILGIYSVGLNEFLFPPLGPAASNLP